MTGPDVIAAMFALCNGLRLLAYLPQIARIIREPNGAPGVAVSTWALFAVANASTVVYALAVAGDERIALAFSANLLCCALIVGLTLRARRKLARAPVGDGALALGRAGV